MISERPTVAYVVSLISGVLIVLGGLIWAVAGTVLALFTFGLGFLLYFFLIFGIIIIYGSIQFNRRPSTARMWGIVIMILGIISLVGVLTALGGVLAIIGGALAVTWRPNLPATYPPPAPTQPA